MATITKTLTLNVIDCAACGVSFAIPDTLQARLRETHQGFYCPSGHANYYSGSNEAEKLRIELKRKEQELADQVQQKFAAQNKVYEVEGKLFAAEKKLKRVSNGVCPCCNRTFKNLAAHMKTKHPLTPSINKPK